jgi:hypothetical protein
MLGTKLNGMGGAAKELVDRARSIARLEVELALLEIKRKVARIAMGIGMGAAAVLFALFGLGFLVAGGAVALALVLPAWAALLIVGGALLGMAIVLVALAVGALRQGTPPVPEEAIEEARRTTEALRSDGK